MSACLAAFLASCSFYTDCPCANQPPPGTTGGTNATGGAGSGNAQSGGMGNSANEAGDNGLGGNAGFGGGDEPLPNVWLQATGNLAGRSVACGNVIYLSSNPHEEMLITALSGFGLWASRDAGETWKALGSSAKSALIQNGTTSIVYDPEDPDTFWEAGIYGPSPFRTDDGGETFVRLGSIDHSDLVSMDFSDPDRQLLLAGGHEQSNVLSKSTDGGESWENIGPNLPSDCQWAAYPIILGADSYLLGCRNGILASEDGGESWEVRASYGGGNMPLVMSNGDIYWTIDMGAGMVRSTDNGQNWERVVGSGVLSNLPPMELPDGSIAALNGRVIVRSSDEGVSWKPVTPALEFTPAGFVYSKFQQAFFVWHDSCDVPIPKDSIMRFDIAF